MQDNACVTDSKFKITPEVAAEIRRNPPINMTVPEAAAYLTIGTRTLWDWIEQRKVKAVRRGARTILRRADLDAVLEKWAA